MTPLFSDAVWSAVGSIPYGKVATYGQIAALSGYPRHARAVGKLLSDLPNDSKLPWHRVINSQGRLSFPLMSERYLEQQNRLAAEGIIMRKGKIPLPEAQWQL